MTFISYEPTGSDSDDSLDGDDTLWGFDGTELVSVGLSPDEQLREIRIDSAWKSKIEPETLSNAVLAAYMGAVRARITTNPFGAPQAVPAQNGDSVEQPSREIPVIDSTLLARARVEQEDYLATYDDELSTERTFTSLDGNVTVSARGGSPSSIAFDDAWLGFADARHIAQSATEALTPAIESASAIAEQMRERFPAMAEFRRLRALKKAARGF